MVALESYVSELLLEGDGYSYGRFCGLAEKSKWKRSNAYQAWVVK